MKKVSARSDSKNLGQLLERVAFDRDQDAFNKLYVATKGKLFLTAMRITQRGQIAEEVVQEGYSRIWLKAESYRASLGSPMNWMICIVRNLAIDVIKKSAWEIYADDSRLMELTSACPSALEMLEADEDRLATAKKSSSVLAALDGLDPMKRDLVIAAYILGESRAQLSKRAGVPVNTVKTWLRRTLLEVKEILRNSESHSNQAAKVAEFHGYDCFNSVDAISLPTSSVPSR